MPRPNFQDIIPPDRRSIQRIPVPERRRHVPVQEESRPVQVSRQDSRENMRQDRREPERPVLRQTPPKRRRGFRIFLTLFILLIILGVAFWFVSRVSGADVVITPKQQSVSLNGQFTASTSAASGVLQFQTITIAKDGKLAIQATGQQMANDKASGTIVIYNTSKASQKLIANTRFATSKGLIFRISQAVTVPAASGSTPGSVEAPVVADQPGPDYNVGDTADFTIPGFKGDPKYTQFYARTKPGSPIQGGFTGMKNTVSDADVSSAKDKIHAELASNLISEATKDIPTGFVMPNNAYYIEYTSLPETSTDSNVEVNERATFHGFIFNRNALAQAIAQKSNANIPDQNLDISNPNNLTFSLVSPKGDTPWQAQTIVFSLQGTTTLVSVIDTGTIQNELVGQPRKSLNAILAGYPSVEEAQVTMRPFWKSTFPTNKDEIAVTVKSP